MKQSISKILNSRIAIAVICINLLLGLFFYALLTWQAEDDFKKSIELQAKHLGNTFAHQLWLFDLNSAKLLSELALDSPEIRGLRLTDDNNNVIVEKGRLNVEAGNSLHSELRFQGNNLVGYLELSFTDKSSKNQTRKILFTCLFMVGVTILLTFFIVSYLLNRHLVNPLRLLQEDMDDIADGQLNTSSLDSKSNEIDSIIRVFNKMAVSLAQREEQREKVEAERKILEDQLHQSQKIESIGRLAGGVAHDYNNMLSVIMGNVELAQIKAEQSKPVDDNLGQILQAANRSRDITRQLLAFARKQIIDPKVLNLNISVENMLNMLRNLLGENIDLRWHPKEDIWPVKLDPSQLDQVLANLCLNARDAIADVGKMTIETDTVRLDEDYCKVHPGFKPGHYVLLSVSDDGCGMDKKTLDNIFEPFFTTKHLGDGTGLGLAMVYGIVKQSGGFINVYSEPGQGTTFKIFIPSYEGESAISQETILCDILEGQGETVLLVEDEVAIVELTRTMLEDLGYKVLAVDSPLDALSQVKDLQGDIHLLLTDVVMPEMNGKELAKKLSEIYPDMKVLYMSGYTANAIAHHGVLDEGINFIQKPFSRRDLSVHVRQGLDTD